MQRQGGVHNPVIPREKAVAESFHERIVEVALEQWTQRYLFLIVYSVGFNVSSTLQEHSIFSTDRVQRYNL